MIPEPKVDEIKALLACGGHSRRKIARMTGISRGTVNAIANGRRPDYRQRHKDSAYDPYAHGRYEKCPDCGAKAVLHELAGRCMACQIRRRQAAGELPRIVSRPSVEEPTIRPDLTPGDAKRYRRARRRHVRDLHRAKTG
jgi:hypothetical protein